MKTLFILFAAMGLCGLASLSAETRTFIDQNGRSLEGELVSTDGEMVTIKRSDDGLIFTVKATSFCKADQDYFVSKGAKVTKPPTPAPAVARTRPSLSDPYLLRIFGVTWEMKKSEMLGKFASQPGVRRERDHRSGAAHFEGGKYVGKSVGGSYFAFHDERLTWMDTNIPAPGNELAVFQEVSKNLDVLLGPSDKMQTDKNGGRLKRVRIWMTTSGPPSGVGEVVKLTLIEGEHRMNLRVEDPKYQR